MDRLFHKYSFAMGDAVEEEAAVTTDSEENVLGVVFLAAPFAYALASLAVCTGIFFFEIFRKRGTKRLNVD